MLVDRGVWADYFNGEPHAHANRLYRALQDRESVALAPVILTEVLQGFRTDAGFRKASKMLKALPCLALDPNGHIEAASMYRTLRKRGITLRGAIDAIIAQTAIAHGVELLSPDRDFAGIAKHFPLKLAVVRR